MSSVTWNVISGTPRRSESTTHTKTPGNARRFCVCVPRSAALALGQDVLELGMHAAQGFFGGAPVNKGIGDRHAVVQVGEVFRNRLATPVQVALDHQADDRLVAFEDLVGDVLHHQRLQGRVLVGVGVAAIDHDVGLDLGLGQRLFTDRDTDRVVVRLAVATAQYHVAIGVALGGDDGHATFLVDTQETVRAGHRLQRVDRHGQAAVGAVLEAHGRGQTRRHFAVGLGFGGARADGRPTDQVLQVLRGDRIKGFGGGGQAHFGQVQQQLATDVQAVLDLERVVQVRIVDQAFPADGGARLFEIDAHDQIQRVGHFFGQRLEALGVFVGSLEVVDRARPDYHEEAVVGAVENVTNDFATLGDGLQCSVAQGNFALELIGRDQGLVGFDVQVVDR